MASASLASSRPVSLWVSAAAFLIRTTASTNGASGARWEIGKFCRARSVCTPYSAAAGTASSPRGSCSIRVSIRCGQSTWGPSKYMIGPLTAKPADADELSRGGDAQRADHRVTAEGGQQQHRIETPRDQHPHLPRPEVPGEARQERDLDAAAARRQRHDERRVDQGERPEKHATER